MTANQMLPAVGASVEVRFEELTIQATVLDVKHVWGKARLLIAPVAGAGQQWIELSRLTAASRPSPKAWKELR